MENLLRSYASNYVKKTVLYDGDFNGIAKDSVNNLLQDIENYPHAFILGCAMDYCVDANIAWSIPLQIKNALGGDFSIKRLISIDSDNYEEMFNNLNPKHRFSRQSARIFKETIDRIKANYDGNASKMWNENSAELFIKSFRSFYHVGQKISNMAANLLYTHLNVKFLDMDKIDIAVDRHVERVFTRTGLVMPSNNTKTMVIAKARELCPDYPGKLDLPIFNLGRNCCTRQNPKCDCCPLAERCPKNNIG